MLKSGSESSPKQNKSVMTPAALSTSRGLVIPRSRSSQTVLVVKTNTPPPTHQHTKFSGATYALSGHAHQFERANARQKPETNAGTAQTNSSRRLHLPPELR